MAFDIELRDPGSGFDIVLSSATPDDNPDPKAWASANSGTGTSSTVSIDIPASVVDGDVGYLLVTVNTNTERDDPGGVWTELDYQTTGTVLGAKVYRADLLTTDAGDTLSWGLGAAQKWTATMVIVEDDGGVDVTANWSTGTNHTAWTAPALTPTVDNVTNLVFHAWRVAATGTTTQTPPTGWTEGVETSVNASSSPTNGGAISWQKVTGGAGVSTGADTDGGYDQTSSDALVFALAIQPVGAGVAADGSGSITLGGSVGAAVAGTASGSVTLAGSVTGRAAASASGALTLAGTGTARAAVTASGTVTLAATSAASGAVTGSGSVTLAGTVTARGAASASGSVTLDGTATPGGPTAAGSVTLAGTATAQAATTATGSITLGGSAAARAAATATGSITLGGSATSQAPLTATGSVTLGGSATAQARATASGSVTLTATAGAQGRATATGSITLTGTADAAAGGGLIPGFARETFPARTKASLTLTGTTARDTVRAGTTVRFGGTGARTHEFTPSHATAKEPQHV